MREKDGLIRLPANGGVEGSWEDVMRVIGQAHCMLHEKGIIRIQTDIRVGSRYVLGTTEWFWKWADLRTGRIRSRRLVTRLKLLTIS